MQGDILPMTTLHVQKGIQFHPELYSGQDRSGWFKALGEELAARKLTVTLAPGLEIRSADDAVKLYQRYKQDPAALGTAISLPAGTTLENYFSDLVQALDDTVKQTTDLRDTKLDFGPSSEMSKALGLDSKARYASGSTRFGAAPAGQAFSVLGIQLSRNAPPPDPLAGQLYMDATTFAGMPAHTWSREGVEMEQVYGISGVDPHALLDALRATNRKGRTAFQRLRKPEICEAFSLGYSGVDLEDMKWDADAHRMRETNPLVSLTIESGRYDVDPGDGKREISVGTDKMDDTYYDTKDYALYRNDHVVRARARWDTDTEIRRLLVGVKTNTTVDENGIKQCDKDDIRNDSASPEDIQNLDAAVRTGHTHWGGRDAPISVLKSVYEAMDAKGVLQDVGPHKGVLQLEPQLHMRSVRSRYHLNETGLSALQMHYKQTSARLQVVLDSVAAAKGRATGADLKKLEALEKDARALMDGAGVAALAEKELKALDPAMTVNADTIKALMPDLSRSGWGGGGTANTQDTVDKKRVVADALSRAFHDVGGRVNDMRELLAGSQGSSQDRPEMIRAFVISQDKTLLNKQTMDVFVARHQQMLAKPEAELQKDVDAFNAFGAAQKQEGNRDFRDYEPMDLAAFRAVGPYMQEDALKTTSRMLESAGSTAQALWFDEARAFYVPRSTRNTGNFLIDTTDMTEFLKHTDWEAIPQDQRTPAHDIARDKVFHATLVNETQIELGLEKPYLERIGSLKKDIRTDVASLAMKWLDAQQPTSVAGGDYAAAVAALLQSDPARRDEALGAFNAFIKAQSSSLAPVTAESLGAVEAELFTPVNRDKAVRTDPASESALAGAEFVFQQYLSVQEEIVKAKGKRVLDVLEDAGLQGAQWGRRDESKGDTGLKILAGIP